MTGKEIKKVLDSHQKWINEEDGGERAHMHSADLRGADLRWVDLRWADLSGTDLSGTDLSGADLYEADLCRADLSGTDLHLADLRGADIRGANLHLADLRGADLDFSCFPLWCGGSKFKCDTKLIYQLLAHICTLDFPDDEGIKDLIMPFAVKSHRAQDLGIRDKK